MDGLDDELRKQAARSAQERKATRDALETQGAAVNAIATRLGATTSQAVVRAFKSAESIVGAKGAEPPSEPRSRSSGAAFNSKAPLGAHEA